MALQLVCVTLPGGEMMQSVPKERTAIRRLF